MSAEQHSPGELPVERLLSNLGYRCWRTDSGVFRCEAERRPYTPDLIANELVVEHVSQTGQERFDFRAAGRACALETYLANSLYSQRAWLLMPDVHALDWSHLDALQVPLFWAMQRSSEWEWTARRVLLWPWWAQEVGPWQYATVTSSGVWLDEGRWLKVDHAWCQLESWQQGTVDRWRVASGYGMAA